MAISVCDVSITEAELGDTPWPNESFSGAVVHFLGVVRGLEDGRAIEGIDYEAHREMAEHQLRVVAEEAAAAFKLHRVEIRHRIGFVQAGEPSVAVRVASGHRAAAFAGNQWIMDELKRRVPIWKRVVFQSEPDNAKRAEKDQATVERK